MIEVTRLKARVGGFHKYTDQANIYHPDPVSTHFIAGMWNLIRKKISYISNLLKFEIPKLQFIIEADRFDKDFSVADRRTREVEVEKKHQTFGTLR